MERLRNYKNWGCPVPFKISSNCSNNFQNSCNFSISCSHYGRKNVERLLNGTRSLKRAVCPKKPHWFPSAEAPWCATHAGEHPWQFLAAGESRALQPRNTNPQRFTHQLHISELVDFIISFYLAIAAMNTGQSTEGSWGTASYQHINQVLIGKMIMV